jgi:hypothetical protein
MTGSDMLSSSEIGALADEFSVAPSTIVRWIDGASRPHPRLMDEFIHRLVEMLIDRRW